MLIFSSTMIVFVLGAIHLIYTFASTKFSPRDAALEARLKEVSPVISKETTMWKAWIGFNASHSLGAMLFGLIYGYLSVFQFAFLVQTRFLLILGGLFLACFLVLAKRYWFRIPLLGIGLSLALYIAGFAAALA